MMRLKRLMVAGLIGAAGLSGALWAAEVGTAFTYQGVLENPPGQVVNDMCAFEFALCNDAAAACAPGIVSSHAGVEVLYGVFTVPDVDFGAGVINGEARWMAISVKCTGDASFVALSPLVELTPAPYALALPGLRTEENNIGSNVIGGSPQNSVTPGVGGATISGGGAAGPGINRVTDNFGTIGGGAYNEANGDGCTVGGGLFNTADMGDGATVGGGYFNTAGDFFATVGGGEGNAADFHASTVGGGSENTASGVYATVAGGDSNVASGLASTVPGGSQNEAGADYSFAAGLRAKVASDDGTFVWADSADADFTSTGPNQFLVRASGGVGIGTNAPAAQLDVNGATKTTTLEIGGGTPLLSSVVGWGSNDYGQVDIPGDIFVAVSAGGYHAVGIRSDGTLFGWGLNNYGQIYLPTGTFTSVATGADHSLAIRTDGTLIGRGSNNSGETDVPSGVFVAVAAGGHQSLAIRDDATLVCWGDTNGACPTGTFTAISAGPIHSIAIRTDGTLAGWGNNGNGEIDVPSGTFVGVAAGSGHSLAIRSDGTLAAWGANNYGQINAPSGTFIGISAGESHSLAIRSDGTLIAWGRSDLGQIDVPSGNYTAVSAGFLFGLAIRDNPSFQQPGLRLLVDSAAKPGTNTWTIYSDRRLKKNITPLSGALDHLLQLRGVTFNWMDPASQGGITGTQMGLIADEVQRVFPQWVGRDPKGYQTLTVGGFEALTAEAMRELREEKDRQIGEKDCEIEELKARLGRLEALFDSSTTKSGGRE